ncbi:sugar ABC transporter ATP-binding protein [Gracilibacillus massiliensis]|uniref:sugar ABC transporter ATP-binding protein n=1 Tax=Gracilibacillus massiliensis TaxID=1564956 RepID=UPI00071DEF9A|nr:sugar ABC transporter ATP-binding protein [Gracilibacillus massiliensis]
MREHNEPIIQFQNVTKVFPGVKALEEVSFEVKKGEIHALLGENGAGKSTLLNILHGVYTEYEGSVRLKKNIAQFKSANDAIEQGISKVHQEVSIIPEITVGQNIVLGYEPKRGFLIDYKTLHEKANHILSRLNCNFKSEDMANTLSTGEMQMVAIAKAIYHKAEVISFDEPTASLSTKETKALFKIINELKNDGMTIIYVSHRLEEIFEICDRASILRDGKFVDSLSVSDITKEELIKKMVGRDVSSFAVRNKQGLVKDDEVVLEVENLTLSNVFENISFQLKKGEILGFSGLVGSKRTDVLRTVFGAEKKTSGSIKLNGKEVNIASPEKAVQLGIGLIPENRKTQGFVKYFDNANNIGLTKLEKFTKFGLLQHNKKTKNCEHYVNEINLRPVDPHYMTVNLSGGNQQKVVISKWLSSDAEVLILDEPTKGVDVGAKAEIYRVLEELLEKGKSIIIISSELPEVLGMSDRIIVMREGKKVKELDNKQLTEEDILQYAMGVNNHESKIG